MISTLPLKPYIPQVTTAGARQQAAKAPITIILHNEYIKSRWPLGRVKRIEV
jgi:hypothetical protein